MIGSSSTGEACSSACFIASEPGDLERHLGGVDGVVGAVVEADAHVLDRVAGDDARVHRLEHALLDRGDEPGGDHAALDRVDELEPAAPASSGSISMWQSPN